MNHRQSLKKLNRNAEHRRALLRNMATSLVLHGKIETTLPKAKALKRVADKLITLGKKDSLHARRQALAFLQPLNRHAAGNAKKTTAMHTLFTELAPRFAERNGGYTRVIRTRRRSGDNTQLALIMFVEAGAPAAKAGGEKKKRRVVKSAPKAEVAVAAE
jgi:large subunit ribosomal protein L17